MLTFLKAVPALAIALLAAPGARADGCRQIDTLIATSYIPPSLCSSPVGVCTVGTVASGPLAGTTRFTVLTATQGATPAQSLYTGELVITTRSGTLTLRDYGFFDAATGKYFELQQVVSGTGKFEEATGTLTSAGYGTLTGFFGTLTGTVCSEGGKDHEGGERDSE